MSITVNAESYDYPYVACLTDTNGVSRVFISSAPIHAYTSVRNASSTSHGFFAIGSITGNDIIELVYNESLNQWQTSAFIKAIEEEDFTSLYIFGTSTKYDVDRDAFIYYTYTNMYQKFSIITNTDMVAAEQAFFTSYSNDLTQLPQGLTESAIRDILDQQLNTSTQSGQTAQTIINNTTTQYNLYLSGNIDSTEMQQIITNNLDTLSDLTPSTLLDSMQINNALTYNQSIQDQILNTTSSDLSTFLSSQIATANTVFQQYKNGTRTQEDVISRLRELVVAVSQKSATYTSTADLSAINATVNTINSISDSISNLKDLSTDVSDKVQQSDAEELELLNEMVLAMEQEEIEQPFEDQQTMSDAQSVRDSIANVWINKYMVALVTMFGMLVIPCIVLRTHYRLM